jgi:NAD(P)-dependent dehydrogenase (short-subunit alcohol dehydrogenase family)
MDLQLKDKRALVTGSTAGIGYAIARGLLREGARVCINGRTAAHVEEAAARLREEVPGAQIEEAAADFGSQAEVQALVARVPDVDILVNNVGIFALREFADIPDEDWFRFFEVNVMSGVRLSRHYFRGMLARGWGRIIFISSESALNIPAAMIHYGATKTMQLGVARGLAELTRGTAVTVNAILPGPTRSAGIEGFIEEMSRGEGKTREETEREFFRSARPTSLLQRFATTEEVASLVVYVASPLSSATNGAALRVDGGVVKTVA